MFLGHGIELSGTVVDTAGKPIAGVSITRNHEWRNSAAILETDDEGRFKILNLRPGMMFLTFQSKGLPPQTLTVTNQEQMPAINLVMKPGKVFKGKVTEIGSQAVLRSSGLTTTQTTTSTQEAKDFKVVVTLANPPENLRPGLSATAKIKTAERKNVVAIPIQALAVRTRKDLEEAAKTASKQGSSGVTLAAPPPAAPGDPKKDEVQGVFVVNGKKAIFRPVETGIAGVTDIEITKGLQSGDEIVVGSYKALRTLKPEAQIKVDNSAPKKQEDQQS